MAVRFWRGNSFNYANQVKTVLLVSDKQIPIPETSIMSLTPLYIDIELSNEELEQKKNNLKSQFSFEKKKIVKNRLQNQIDKIEQQLKLLSSLKLRLAIKQLTTKEYSELYYYLNVIKQMIMKTENGFTKNNEQMFITFISHYIAKLITCETPELLVDSNVIRALNIENINFMSYDKILKLFNECITFDDRFFIKDFVKYKHISKMKLYYYTHIKDCKLIRSHLKTMAKKIIEHELSELIQNLSFDKVIWIANRIIEYNDGSVKKNLTQS